jgi:hypothetical protein
MTRIARAAHVVDQGVVVERLELCLIERLHARVSSPAARCG